MKYLKNPDKDYLDKRISEGEHLYLDFKFEISDSKKIARTFSAFSNTLGGSILVGIKDNGKVVGIKNEEEMYMVQGAAGIHVSPKISPKYKILNYNKLQVLEVLIDEGKNKPYLAPDENSQKRAYIRIQDNNLPAPEVLLLFWKKNGRKDMVLSYNKPEETLIKYLEKHKSITINQFMRMAMVSSMEANEIISDLLALHVLAYYFEDKEIRFLLK